MQVIIEIFFNFFLPHFLSVIGPSPFPLFSLHSMLSLLLLASVLSASSTSVVPLPSTAFTYSPLDRWSTRSISRNASTFLSKWGSSTAVAASLVNATSPPFPTAVGLLYGMGSSNGFMRVSLNGQVVVPALNTFGAVTNYTNELVLPLKKLPNLPLWVLAVEATGTWESGSKDSYIEVVGVNVYYP